MTKQPLKPRQTKPKRAKSSPLNAQPAQLQPSCTQHIQHVTVADLPLCCPVPGTTLWDAHPRVFLAFDTDHLAQCPYCGTNYILDA